MKTYFLAFFCIFLSSIAQLFLKKGSGAMANINTHSIVAILTNRFLMAGLFCYGLSSFLWMNVLSKMKLSVAYPMASLAYVLTFVLAYFVLNEEIHTNQVAGLGFIMIGIFVLTR